MFLFHFCICVTQYFWFNMFPFLTRVLFWSFNNQICQLKCICVFAFHPFVSPLCFFTAVSFQCLFVARNKNKSRGAAERPRNSRLPLCSSKTMSDNCCWHFACVVFISTFLMPRFVSFLKKKKKSPSSEMPSLPSAENFNIWRKRLLIGTEFALPELSGFLKLISMDRRKN